jgi:hypothetical protein
MSPHNPGPVELVPLLLELPPVAEPLLLPEDGLPPLEVSLVALVVPPSDPPVEPGVVVVVLVVLVLAFAAVVPVPPVPVWSLVFASLPQPLSAPAKPRQQTVALAVRAVLVRVNFAFRVLIVLSLLIEQMGARADPRAPNLLHWLRILAHREKLSLPKAAYFGLRFVVSFRSQGSSLTGLRSGAETGTQVGTYVLAPPLLCSSLRVSVRLTSPPTSKTQAMQHVETLACSSAALLCSQSPESWCSSQDLRQGWDAVMNRLLPFWLIQSRSSNRRETRGRRPR